MEPDDHVCLCFRVSLRKLRAYLKREDPPVASLMSQCLGAGTGCQWCVPFLKELHRQHAEGDPMGADGQPDLRISPQRYAQARTSYRRTGQRPTIEDAASDGRDRPGASGGDEASGEAGLRDHAG